MKNHSATGWMQAIAFLTLTASIPLSAAAAQESVGLFRFKLLDDEIVDIKSLKEVDYEKAQIKDCKNEVNCEVLVEVKAPTTGDLTNCTWKFPAIVVVKEPKTKITWKLQNGTAGAKFEKDIGITIHPEPGVPLDYEAPTVFDGGLKFSWTRKAAGLRIFRYDFHVMHSNDTVKCTPPDPLIINMD
jgi:hypothetical protein